MHTWSIRTGGMCTRMWIDVWLFRSFAIFPPSSFTPWLIRLLASSPPSWFAPSAWTIRHWPVHLLACSPIWFASWLLRPLADLPPRLRPGSRWGTKTWPNLRLKWPQVDGSRLEHIRLDLTWLDNGMSTSVNFKRLETFRSGDKLAWTLYIQGGAKNGTIFVRLTISLG